MTCLYDRKTEQNKGAYRGIFLRPVFHIHYFNHNIDGYFNGINYIAWTVFMLILFVVTVVFFIKNVRRSIKKESN